PKIDEKAQFKLKGQFLKELHDNTFGGSDNEDGNENIEKVRDIVDLFHIPNITQDQELILFYKGLDVPTRQILDSKVAIPSMKAADAKKAIQDMANHSQKWHNGTFIRCRSTETSDGLAAIQAQLNNLGREIKKVNEIVKEDNIKQQLQDSTKGTMETLVSRAKTNNGRINEQVYGRICKKA
ncbi:hypothetical protein Tco_0332624, partial [Tanacetum coccineum]